MKQTKTTMMMGVAALALAMAAPAMAQETNTNMKVRGDTAVYKSYTADEETITKKEVERTLEKAGDSIKRTKDKVVNAVEGNTHAAAATSVELNDVNVAQNNSADFLIGKAVMNASGDRIGTVHDLILSDTGSVDALIIADGGRMVFGDKKAAFDFSVINGRDSNGGVLTSITQDQIDQAKNFDYDVTAQADATTQIKAPGQTSARELLGAKITGPDDKRVGTVRDIALNGNDVSKVIIAYDQILGLGGKRAAVDYSGLSVSPDNKGRPSVALSAPQAALLANNS